MGGGAESRADRSAGRRTARRGLVGSSPQPLSPKGDPPKRPTTNQKSQHTIPSLRFQNPLRGRRVFLPVSQGGLPGGRGAQAPGAAQPPELQEVGRTSVTALQGSDAGVPGPRSGVEINTAPAARRRCRRCPAGPRGQPCCSASCRPLRPPADPWQVPTAGSPRRAAAAVLPRTASGTATSPLGRKGPVSVSSGNRVQRGNQQRKCRAYLDPRALLGARVPVPGDLWAALRPPACCLFGVEKLPEKKPGSRQVRKQGGKKIFFARGV